MITLIVVGKIKEKALTTLINEYKKRITSYSKIEIIEVGDEPNDKLEEEKVKELEGQKILKQIKRDSYVILLDLKGQSLDSEELAKKIEQINTYHSSNITFIIGGSLGVSESVKEKADFRLKLSEMTFPHNIVRLLILEQIYRSYKILNNETYHK
ncbi:MAG TPA: 23S rRNA (pseudouridine(1915)-N(3))-methyltransferase RlmH [Erysipelotrichaceae bacterium]|nr:23S rRNA (pseudouridine(1915)-N(3))-methyltransferase RlmH [Erysipelotrichia bacterium]HPX32244.1 23S rRNA (pseudouridine(1915)-N(3))-methyltransferase RlmH [Erysipelotrichaceae bacterium]HQA84754.1 23S rRNA (pseudouridine(1915)-N(3))-methyltransferase RlmH [Erysipelotrichaceae bacterium]